MVSQETNLRFAFKKTMPLLGDIFLGMAFGVYVVASGYPWYYATLLCLLLFTGAFQFIIISLLANQVGLGQILGIAIMMNSRMAFYGIPFVNDFRRMGWRFPIMVHLMSDGNFAIMTSSLIPKHLDRDQVRFFITIIGAVYWVGGATLGAVIGNITAIDTAGIEFGLTALFVTILLDMWKDLKSHTPIGLGFICGIICLILLGPNYFILPALCLAVTGLLIFRGQIEQV